jgi:hypothetical protein
MRTIQPYPPEMTEVLLTLGNRKLVWVEGPDDKETFREWFMEKRSEVEFYAAGGWKAVEDKIQEYLAHNIPNVFGIIDRDFRSTDEVESTSQNPEARLFILRRYTIENYLLEPAALHEELRLYYDPDDPVPSIAELEAAMLALCQKLLVLMAANWVLSEISPLEHERYFQPEYELQDRDALIRQAAQRARCSVEEIEQRIMKKEADLAPLLSSLDTAHTCINGKHLLHQLYKMYIVAVKTGFHKKHLRRLLVRTVKQCGIHADIVAIVEQRILQHT